MRSPMKTVVTLAVMALCGTSSLAAAQMGGSRSSQRNNNSPEDIGIVGAPPMARTVAALAIEHAAELALTDGATATNPRAVRSVAEIVAVYQQAL